MSELTAGLWLAGLLLLAIILYQLAKQANSNLLSALLAVPCALVLWCVADLVGILPTFQPAIVATNPAIVATNPATESNTTVMATTNVTTNWTNVPPGVARWQLDINDAAAHCGLDPLLIAAVMWQESSGAPNAIGGAGEIGLMQIMPFADRPLAQIRADPAYNILWGACYLAQRIQTHGDDLHAGIKAYNGTGAAAEHYAQLVIGHWQRFAGQVAQPAQPTQYTRFSAPPFTAFTITSHFRSFDRPNHKGVDIAAKGDNTIRAVESGFIEHIGPFYCTSPCLGPLAVVINHGTWRTVYGHSDTVYVNPGDTVVAGQPIARQGALGNATGPHLHLEMRIGGEFTIDNTGVANIIGSYIVNPTNFLP